MSAATKSARKQRLSRSHGLRKSISLRALEDNPLDCSDSGTEQDTIATTTATSSQPHNDVTEGKPCTTEGSTGELRTKQSIHNKIQRQDAKDENANLPELSPIEDSGAPSVDSGAPSVDSGASSMGSGARSVVIDTPSVDSGVSSMDSGVSRVDSSASSEDIGWGGYLGGVLGKAAKVGANFLQTSFQYVPTIDVETDSEEDWNTDDNQTDSDSGGDDFEDALEDVKPKDRLHNIAHELLTTEVEYVKRLAILVKVRAQACKVLQPEVVHAIFKDVEAIHLFHSDHLLPELKLRLQYWEKHKGLGDIMSKMAPFLKIYTEYVKGFQKANDTVELWEKKSTAFGKVLKEVKENPRYGKLKLQHFMMEPVQRVPRYRLLLADYHKRLTEDSPDKEDIEKALKLIGDAANHFEKMMVFDTKMGKLLELQGRMDGSISIVNFTRELVREGKVKVVNTRSGKLSERTGLLFSDLLLLCRETLVFPTMPSKLQPTHAFHLLQIKVSEGGDADTPHLLHVRGGTDSAQLAFNSAEHKQEWQTDISTCTALEAEQSTKRLSGGSDETDARADPAPCTRTMGQEPPILVKLSKVSECSLCGEKFGITGGKHHCKACGQCACTACSSHQLPLAYDLRSVHRVCDTCWVLATDERLEMRGKLPETPSRSVVRQGGVLDVSPDDGKTWERRLTAVLDNYRMYSVRAHKELLLIPLAGCRLEAVYKDKAPSGRKGACVCLQQTSGNRLHISMATSHRPHGVSLPVSIQRWVSALEAAITTQTAAAALCGGARTRGDGAESGETTHQGAPPPDPTPPETTQPSPPAPSTRPPAEGAELREEAGGQGGGEGGEEGCGEEEGVVKARDASVNKSQQSKGRVSEMVKMFNNS